MAGSALEFGSGAANQGRIVQVVNTQDGELNTGTTTIPNDDTIPQIAEGDEYMSLAITPTSASNNLKIEVVVFGTHSTGTRTQVALFQDATSDAIACGYLQPNGNNSMQTVSFNHFMAAGTTSSTTFRVRCGSTGGTWSFNGVSAARFMGGALASSITISEIGPGSTATLSQTGKILQIVNSQSGALQTGSTAIPTDDTIPQITEGDEYYTVAITPNDASNKLMIDLSLNVDAGSTGYTLALFQDAIVDALAATREDKDAAREQQCTLRHFMTAGTTSSITFRLRFGSNSGTTTVNGEASGRLMGGVMASSITVTEISV